MTKPTGQAWRNWKKGQVRKLLSEGKPIPTNWEEHWCCLHEEPKRLEDSSLKERIRVLSIELEQANRRAITHDAVRHEIIQLARSKPSVPDWLTEHKEHRTSHPGVPTLFLSDWHWGEVVDPKQISGCNKYDLEIAHARARRCVDNAVDLLTNHMVNPRYPGIVLAIGGDMFSGDIHEELSRSNEKPIMPLVLDLYGVLVEVINKLVGAFGKVFVPCVTGNHSRTTRKPQSKDRNAMNFDWLLYCLLEKYFESDKRIKFLVGDGPDVSWQVFGKKYCLTHGDQFRGGDSIIGPLGPITRGDLKKRGRNNSIGDRYDVLLLGHWHQLIQMQRLIVNGSLKGYDEYAYSGNFGFEEPKQALWLTHPEHGITFQVPVLVDEKKNMVERPWVTF